MAKPASLWQDSAACPARMAKDRTRAVTKLVHREVAYEPIRAYPQGPRRMPRQTTG